MLKSIINLDARFYMTGVAGYKNESLVTTEASNPELGVAHIGLRNSESKNPSAPIFKVQLELSCGVIVYGDIFVNKDGKSLNVRWPQDRFTNQQGQVSYADKVVIPTAITAQVLRYAHSRTQDTDAVAAHKEPATSVPSGKPNNLTAQDLNPYPFEQY